MFRVGVYIVVREFMFTCTKFLRWSLTVCCLRFLFLSRFTVARTSSSVSPFLVLARKTRSTRGRSQKFVSVVVALGGR